MTWPRQHFIIYCPLIEGFVVEYHAVFPALCDFNSIFFGLFIRKRQAHAPIQLQRSLSNQCINSEDIRR